MGRYLIAKSRITPIYIIFVIGVIVVGLQQIDNVYVFSAGRAIQGICGGIYTMQSGRILEEYVPQQSFQNIFVISNLLTSLISSWA